MAITQTVTKYQIVDIAKAYNRLDNFGYEGWQKLFEYMEGLSEDQGKDIELDIVAWCCDFSMYESIQDFYSEWRSALGFSKEGLNIDTNQIWEDMDDDEKLEAIEEFLQDNTSLVCCDEDCIIWQAF